MATDRELVTLRIPEDWRSLVCLCVSRNRPIEKRTFAPNFRAGMPNMPTYATSPEVCARCYKPMRFYIMRDCKSCHKSYTYWYIHPHHDGARCYSCVVEATGEEGYYWPEFRPPRSQEEINADLDSLLSEEIIFEF